eukprot:54601_1
MSDRMSVLGKRELDEESEEDEDLEPNKKRQKQSNPLPNMNRIVLNEVQRQDICQYFHLFSKKLHSVNKSFDDFESYSDFITNAESMFNDADKALEFDKFVDSLPPPTNKNTIKELYFRKHAVNEFLARHKTLFYCFEFDDDKFDNDKFNNDKMHNLLNETVMAIRNRKERTWSDSEVWANDGYHDLYKEHYYTKFSIEIALKTTNYKLFGSAYLQIMRVLFRNYIDGIEPILAVICDYSHNGYIWYNFQYDVGREEEDKHWMQLAYDMNEAIMYKLCCDSLANVCFKDNTYCETGIVGGRAVTFDSLRKDLCLPSVNKMNDAQVACFIATICFTAFYNEDNDQMDHDFGESDELLDWIKEKHVVNERNVNSDYEYTVSFNETDEEFKTCETINNFWRY